MTRKVSKGLFYLLATWFVLIGLQNQTISGSQNFEWIAAALEGTDTTKFDPIMAKWAHWIGKTLIISGITLFLLIKDAYGAKSTLAAVSILTIGSVGAQLFTALSLGAHGPGIIIISTLLLCSVLGAILGFLSLKGQDHQLLD
jgi:hypothetical protein